MTILDEMLAHKRREVGARRAVVPLETVRARAAAAPPPRDFAGAIAGPPVRIIAEVKRASPARGILRGDADPAAVARAYQAAGADAISVLTDARYFRGDPADLAAVRVAVPLPVLCKDFIVDPYQVYEARALGADAVLLIAGAVPREVLAALLVLAGDLGLAALVEVDGAPALDDALAAGASIVGINNRDLRTFAVDLEATARLRPRIPAGRLVVSESGIETADDLRRVARAGVDAVLVGTALMTAPEPGAALARLRAAAVETASTGGAHA
ncbi:MAG: indole-3-glycerol phosphate synthase TrpC [Armatimonadota bacterium]|nr:indole-3-glycerol phosphate synthase TrpC [Armatimonadota bacterium]MDR7484739.1 indole-3-glycerol phosphate synthase TrpC [Armatimonadota bacterium]MDR7531854.1 indole-3-glycerol phosphate synthase TrpC [Armatimonadota bacterium]MDR7534801.1 indole-3-glycerol phosphate synthase TrpC [Armatimonadota bacterium]